ncbi:SMP-30/gluconolactonase/LRE family protein [Stakelama sp. CBK3Z-3]|uniref:SMP-30/gluconolactonase/LRE family protein n=1 Tax=Stakelama flava TaxID=2860338 RepID=A0ABS6XM22_9SPHN|nr:SMP-30/gluconolactonase/LRE family protein [Stakelama flava]MBW4331241.1 SMP-30/gluconolactonase/LRE family protein [Stakelama flava]
MVGHVRVIERGGARDELGEGLFWSVREQALYWTDILSRRLNRLTLGDGNVKSWDLPEMTGWVIERANGDGFVAGMQTGFHLLSIDGDRVRTAPIANPHPDLPDNRMNDAKADRAGRIWAGSMPLSADRPSGGLFRLDPDHSMHVMETGYTIANGPTISPDGATFYHTDTAHGLVYRYAFADNGSLGPRETFVRFEEDWGRPDGMTVDEDGGVWIAHWGGACVSRFTPQGERERIIALPASQITNVCFGGADLNRMFVTCAAEGKHDEPLAGSLFEVDTGGVKGVTPGLFGG